MARTEEDMAKMSSAVFFHGDRVRVMSVVMNMVSARAARSAIVIDKPSRIPFPVAQGQPLLCLGTAKEETLMNSY